MGAERKPEPKFPAESRTVEFLPAGVGVDPLAGNVPTLDPELARIREAEIKANDVPINPAPGAPTIDPVLVKMRDEQIRRENERAGVKPELRVLPAKKAAPSKPSK